MSTTINDTVASLATLIKAELAVGDNGVITANAGLDEKIIAANANGLTTEQVKNFQSQVNDLVAATYLAAGELGVAAFSENKELDKVSVTFPFFADSVSVEITRQKEYPAGGVPKEGEARSTEMVTKYGVGYSKYNVQANGNRGALKKARDRISQLAAEALAK